MSLFRKCAQKYPQNPMLVNCASGKEWTYTEVIFFDRIQSDFIILFNKCKQHADVVVITNILCQVEEYSNRVANYFHSLGYKKGDSVAFFMENRPEYIATWLGLAKIGVTPALINYNLKQQSLVHTIQVSNCKAIIYGIELEKGEINVLIKLKRIEFKNCF